MIQLLKRFKNNSIKAGSWYVIGSIFDKAISFITIPIFTRMMTTGEYGIMNTYLSLVSIFTVIVGLSLSQTIRNAYVDYKNDVEKYISTIAILSMISFAVSLSSTVIIVCCFIKSINIYLAVCCVVQAYMYFVVEIAGINYIMQNKYKMKTLLDVIPHFIVTVLSIILIYLLKEEKYWGRIIPYVGVYVVFGIVFLTIIISKSIKKTGKCFDKSFVRYALMISMPLIFHGLSMSVLSQMDRVMITAIRSESETGIYSLYYNLGLIPLVLSTAINNVWIPWNIKKMQEENYDEINKRAKIIIEFMAIVVVLWMCVSPEFVKLLAPSDYWNDIQLVVPIIVAAFFVFLYTFEVHVEYYYKKTKWIALNTFIAAILNLVLNFIFIPKFGALAAAYTTLFSYVVLFILHCIVVGKLNSKVLRITIYIFPLLCILIASLFISIFIKLWIVRYIALVVISIIYTIVFIKKKRYREILKR